MIIGQSQGNSNKDEDKNKNRSGKEVLNEVDTDDEVATDDITNDLKVFRMKEFRMSLITLTYLVALLWKVIIV